MNPLSLSPWFERGWCSLYEAFEDGRIDQERLRHVFASYLLPPADGEPVWLGIDATSIERPESKTSPDCTVVYKPNLPESSKPIVGCWQGRRARYRRLRKNLFDLRRCAVVHNLHVLARSQQAQPELQAVA